MPGGLASQVEAAQTLTAQVKAELDASALALDKLENFGCGSGDGASSAELEELRRELEAARAEALREREKAKAASQQLEEVKRAYEEMKRIAEKRGFGEELAAITREANLDKWLCRKVFERLYSDAMERQQRYQERASSAFWMQTNSFTRCAEQVQQVIVPPRGNEGELLGLEVPIRSRERSPNRERGISPARSRSHSPPAPHPGVLPST